jgi:hypothetical protein
VAPRCDENLITDGLALLAVNSELLGFSFSLASRVSITLFSFSSPPYFFSITRRTSFLCCATQAR